MPTENRSSNTELISQAASAIEDLLANGTGAVAAGAWASLPAELRKLTAQPSPQPHAEPVALAIPDECPHLIVFDDTEVASLMFSGAGARAAALKKWEAISTSWNAHLFVRVGRNSRDDGHPCATAADPGEVERLSQIIRDLNEERDELGAEAGRLRAKLAERDALLEDWHTANCTGEVNVSDKAYRIVTRTAAILSPGAKPSALVDHDDRSDIVADAAYRNGVMHGYKLAMEGDEAEYQACINSLTGHLQTARAALNQKPS